MLCIVEGHWNVLQPGASPCMVINRDNDLMWQKNMVQFLFSLNYHSWNGEASKFMCRLSRGLRLYQCTLPVFWINWNKNLGLCEQNTSQIIKIDVNIWVLIAFINKLLMKTIATRESTTKGQSKMPITFITVTTAIYPQSLLPHSQMTVKVCQSWFLMHACKCQYRI